MTTKHTPGPVTGPYHGSSIADQLRLIGSLCGTDHPTGKAEQRAAVAYVSVVTAQMLEALEGLLLVEPTTRSDLAWEMLTIHEKARRYDLALERIKSAIAKARGEG